MLSPFPKTASCVYSLGTGKIPCTTQKSYLHRKPQSPFSAQTIRVHFKKALYTWQALPDHRWSRIPWAIWGRAPFHSYIRIAKLPPATTACTKTSRIWVMVGWDPWKVHLLASNVQKLLHDPYRTGMGETESLPQLKEQSGGVTPLPPSKNGGLPKKKKKKTTKNQTKKNQTKPNHILFWKMYLSREDKKSCLLSFIPSRRIHGNYQETIILSPIVHNDTTNSDFSNNHSLNVAISSHSNSLWDPNAPIRLSFPRGFPHAGDTAIIQ